MEKMFQQFERTYSNKSSILPTDFRLVRYGNVLYSTGSVLCKWKELIQEGKEVVVTEPSATRFFWTVEQAVDLIWDCMENAKDATPYCPEMKSMRIDEKTMKTLHWRPGTKVSGAVLWCPGQFGGWSLGNQ